jgi:hypothetical protein
MRSIRKNRLEGINGKWSLFENQVALVRNPSFDRAISLHQTVSDQLLKEEHDWQRLRFSQPAKLLRASDHEEAAGKLLSSCYLQVTFSNS